MGNSEKTIKNNIDDDELEKRFNESFMDIYVCGKYNRLMDILIGEKKFETIDEDNDEKEYFKSKKKNNEKKETSSIKFKDDQRNNNLYEKEIDIYEFLNNIKNNQIEINSNSTKENLSFNWKFHFYCKKGFNYNSIEKIRDNILNDIDNKNKNTLILFINSINDIYKIIEIFNKIDKEYHPLFLFILSENNKEKENEKYYKDIKQYISDNNINMFNIRNITIKNEINIADTYLENKNIIKSYIIDMYLYLINAWFYYNNFGDDYTFREFLIDDNLKILLNELNQQNLDIKENINKGKGLFNILILGRPGVGKSTLVNLLSNSKRSMEAKGLSATKYITRYIIKKYNISLYDSPGFELDKDVDKINELIKELNEYLLKKRNQIHLVFYLLNSQGSRDFYNSERTILKTLITYQIPIFFLLTFCPDQDIGKEIKEVIENDLKKLFYQFDQKNGINNFYNLVKIIPVHLLDEPNNSCRNFGLKTMLEEAYNKFQNYIIEDNDLNKIKSFLKNNHDQTSIQNDGTNKKDIRNNIFELLNNKSKNGNNGNILYRYIKDIDDLIISAKVESESTINKYSIGSIFIGFFGFLTSRIIKFLKKKILLQIAENFKKDISDKEKLVESYSDDIYENSLQINIPIYSSYGSYKNIKAFGNFYVDKYIKELQGEGLDGLEKYIIHLIISYNNAIEGLKILGQQFNE